MPEGSRNLMEGLMNQFRDDDLPIHFYVWPGAMEKFKISLLDAAILWFVTYHCMHYGGFCGLTYELLAEKFNVIPGSVRNSLKKMSSEREGVLTLLTEVKPSKEQHLEYLKKLYEVKSKYKEEGLLRANCYAITSTWVSYIKPWVAAGMKVDSV